jgi:hypothetical protein
MVNRNGAGRGFPIGVWCHSWVLCWIFAGWRRMYVQMARVLKAWHLTNSMCRMERRQSMVTPGAKSIHASTEALQFGYLHQVAIRNRSAIQKTRTKSHREFALCFLVFRWHTIDITSAALKKSSVLWKIDSPWAMDPPTSGSKALALHFSKDLGSETQNLRRTGMPTMPQFLVWK